MKFLTREEIKPLEFLQLTAQFAKKTIPMTLTYDA